MAFSDRACHAAADAAGAAPPRYAHELQAGEQYAPLDFAITPEVNQQFCFSLEDYNPDYVGGGPEGADGALVHPVLLLHMSARTRSPSFRLAPGMGSVFARESVEFLKPARVNAPLRATWTIREVYEKRGKLYQALEIGVYERDGERLLKREMHSVFHRKEPAPPGGGG